MSQKPPPGDNRFSWPPGPIHVPPPPTLVLDELGRALRAAREEEESNALRTIGSRGGKECVGETSPVHRYGRGATSVLRVSA
eukprot:2382757-Pleurochrysis_carterae.AAC.1